MDIQKALETVAAGRLEGSDEIIGKTVDYLGIAVAAVINIFNPSTLFLHEQFMSADPEIFGRVVAAAKQRSLGPSFTDCRILQSRGIKRLGGVAGIIDHLACSPTPSVARSVSPTNPPSAACKPIGKRKVSASANSSTSSPLAS